MPKIDGRFAPLLAELGEDYRFIVESTDLDKLLFILIIFTCHMTRHKAPIDATFYKTRYGLRSHRGHIVASLRRIRGLYPKISWGDKTLSLLNSPTYKIPVLQEVEVEVEKEVEVEVDTKLTSAPVNQFLSAWKEACPFMAGILKLTAARRAKIMARLKEHSLNQWLDIFRRINASDFCRGEVPGRNGQKPWRASLDWIIHNEDNAIKVLEGKYDNLAQDRLDLEIADELKQLERKKYGR